MRLVREIQRIEKIKLIFSKARECRRRLLWSAVTKLMHLVKSQTSDQTRSYSQYYKRLSPQGMALRGN